MTVYEALDLSFKAVAGAFAYVGFQVGLRQYRQGQDWRRAKTILELIDSFKGDPKIQAACQMLDWDRRRLKTDKGKDFLFENEILITALSVPSFPKNKMIPMDAVPLADTETVSPGSQIPEGVGFSDVEVFIRDCFDAFFDFFDKVNAFQASTLVAWTDLDYFLYWVDLVRHIGRWKNNEAIQKVVDTYLEKYDFKGFQEMRKTCPMREVPTNGNDVASQKG
jgi:hypothetical protein